MFIAKSNKINYVGFDGEYHKFKDNKNNSLTLVPQAKFIDTEKDIVFILKENGDIEPSFASQRAHKKTEIEESFRINFTEKQIPGQLRFTEKGKITQE